MKAKRGDYVTLTSKTNPLDRITGFVEYTKDYGNQIDTYKVIKLLSSKELNQNNYTLKSAGIPSLVPLKFLYLDEVYVGSYRDGQFSGAALDSGDLRRVNKEDVEHWEVIM